MEKILNLAAEQYGFDKEKLRFIGDSCNKIYAFQKNDIWYILRISERSAPFAHLTRAELDWMDFLSKNGINVPSPLLTIKNERLIAVQENEKYYIICAYTAFAGQNDYQHWNKNDPNLWNSAIFYNWGKQMGDMHRLTKDYMSSNDIDVRPHFNRFDLVDSVKSCPSVNKIAEDLIGEMDSLPKDRDSYGLIHADMHQWNFLIRDGEINVFDFDDSLYGWFALDIGIALYHALWWGRTNDTGYDFTKDIIKSFINGYLSANQLSDFWLSKIPLFMRYRQICKFSWYYDPAGIDDHQKERIRNIEDGVLFTGCEIDLSLFINCF